MLSPNDNRHLFLPAWVRILALALCVALVTPAMAGEPATSGDIVVVSVRGDVRVTMSGAPRAVQAGTIVELAATIRTGHDGAIDLRQGNTTVAIAADTELKLPATAQRSAIIDVLIQTRGNAFYDVGKRESRKLRVETPYLVAVIKGTQFNVAVQEDGAAISLFEGRLEVRTPDDSDVVDLNAGEIAIRHVTDKTIRVLRMDTGKAPATTSNDGSRRSVAPGPDGASVTPIDAGGAVVLDRGPTVRVVPPGGEPLDLNVRTNAGVSLEAGAGALEAGATAKLGAALSVQVDAGTGAGDVLANAEVNLGAGAADIGAAAAVDLGAASIDTSLDAGVDLGAGAASVAADASVDLGVAAADLGAGAAVDLGAGTVDLAADVGADLGAAGVDAGLDASVDLGAGAVDASAGAAADLGLAALDTSLGVGLDPGAVGVDAALDTSLVGVDLGVDVGVDLGNLGLDVDLGGLDVGLGTDSVTAPAPSAAPAPAPDLGGLLGGLLGGRRGS